MEKEQPVLLLMGPRFAAEPISIKGKQLVIEEEMRGTDGVWGVGTLWDGGVLLANYLVYANKIENDDGCRDKVVFELGSGTGIVGMAAHILGACHVYLSDQSHSLSLLENNISLNFGKEEKGMSVMELNWGETPRVDPHPSMVLAADCVFSLDLIEPMCSSARFLLGNGGVFLVMYEARTTLLEEHLLKILPEMGFVVESISGTWRDDFPERMRLLRCKIEK